jgi:CO/xanthine dehydrogenase Mo-binding subunit
VAAVAALSPIIAAEAVELIEVEYEVLPHVIDVEAAMAADAPLLHDDLFTQGLDQKPEKPSNIAKRVAFSKGDTAAGFREANVIVERRYTTSSRCIRPISSRMPASSRPRPTARCKFGLAVRASS